MAALDTYIKLMRAAESVTARLEPGMAAFGLTVGQFGALEALLHLGPLCQRDLGRKLLRSSGNITVVVGNLALRGLVRRSRRRDDRRFITVSLTEKGRRLISTLFPRHVSLLVREMTRALAARPGGARSALPAARTAWPVGRGRKEISDGAKPGDTLRLARAL